MPVQSASPRSERSPVGSALGLAERRPVLGGQTVRCRCRGGASRPLRVRAGTDHWAPVNRRASRSGPSDRAATHLQCRRPGTQRCRGRRAQRLAECEADREGSRTCAARGLRPCVRPLRTTEGLPVRSCASAQKNSTEAFITHGVSAFASMTAVLRAPTHKPRSTWRAFPQAARKFGLSPPFGRARSKDRRSDAHGKGPLLHNLLHPPAGARRGTEL